MALLRDLVFCKGLLPGLQPLDQKWPGDVEHLCCFLRASSWPPWNGVRDTTEAPSHPPWPGMATRRFRDLPDGNAGAPQLSSSEGGTGAMEVTILIVDDNARLRALMRGIAAQEPDCHV